MVSKKEHLIAALVGDSSTNASAESQPLDKSLNAQAYRRATGKDVPKTMTVWEWEEWYAMHGHPDQHKDTEAKLNTDPSPRVSAPPKKKSGWWHKLLFRQNKPSKRQRNCARHPNEDDEFS